MQTTTDTLRPSRHYFLRTGALPRPQPGPVAAEVQRARLQEREHLARELHDVLNGEIVGARLQLACLRARLGAQPEDVARRLEDLDRRLLAALALKRRILDGLEPEGLRGLGLATSLRAMAREFAEGSGVRVTLDLDETAADGDTQLVIYRLVQEALSNMAKYAGASEAAIVLRDRDRDRDRDCNCDCGVSVEVRDDGRGFDPARLSLSGRGLKGMRQRIEAAGGRLAVDSAPGRGTRIAATLPGRGTALPR